jgi:beta-glucosidase
VSGVLTAGLLGVYVYDTVKASKAQDNEDKKGAEA